METIYIYIALMVVLYILDAAGKSKAKKKAMERQGGRPPERPQPPRRPPERAGAQVPDHVRDAFKRLGVEIREEPTAAPPPRKAAKPPPPPRKKERKPESLRATLARKEKLELAEDSRTSSETHADAMGKHSRDSFTPTRKSRMRDIVSIDDREEGISDAAPVTTLDENLAIRPPPQVKIDTSRAAIINAVVLAEVFQRPDERWAKQGY